MSSVRVIVVIGTDKKSNFSYYMLSKFSRVNGRGGRKTTQFGAYLTVPGSRDNGQDPGHSSEESLHSHVCSEL